MDGNVAEKCNRLLGQLWLPSFEVKSIKMGQRRRQRRRSYPDQDVSFPPKKKLAKLRRCVSHVHFAKIKVVKISAFGKISPQAKRHQPSLLITSLAISTSLTFITR